MCACRHTRSDSEPLKEDGEFDKLMKNNLAMVLMAVDLIVMRMRSIAWYTIGNITINKECTSFLQLVGCACFRSNTYMREFEQQH